MLALIGRKIGMTQLFNDEGMRIPVSVIQVEPNVVVRERTADKNGYRAMGSGADALKKIAHKEALRRDSSPRDRTRPASSWSSRTSRRSARSVTSWAWRYSKGCASWTSGARQRARVSRASCGGTSLPGGPGAHGSKFHREMGSVGTGAFRKIVKGSKMPGRMGNERLTVQNLRLFRVDKEKGLLLINGAVPGRRGGMVVVLKARKK